MLSLPGGNKIMIGLVFLVVDIAVLTWATIREQLHFYNLTVNHRWLAKLEDKNPTNIKITYIQKV